MIVVPCLVAKSSLTNLYLHGLHGISEISRILVIFFLCLAVPFKLFVLGLVFFCVHFIFKAYGYWNSFSVFLPALKACAHLSLFGVWNEIMSRIKLVKFRNRKIDYNCRTIETHDKSDHSHSKAFKNVTKTATWISGALRTNGIHHQSEGNGNFQRSWGLAFVE